jgi:hypothetical protein
LTQTEAIHLFKIQREKFKMYQEIKESDKIEKEIENMFNDYWTRHSIGRLVWFKPNLAFRSFKADKMYNRFITRLKRFEANIDLIPYPNELNGVAERSRVRCKIETMIEKLERKIIANNRQMAHTIYSSRISLCGVSSSFISCIK